MLILASLANVSAYSASEAYTCRGVQVSNPWGCINKTSEFLTSDVMVFAWAKLLDLTQSYGIRFEWRQVTDTNGMIMNGTLGLLQHFSAWSTTDPHTQGYTSYTSYVIWDYFPIDTDGAMGGWKVSIAVEGKEIFNLQFVVKKDPNLVQRTITSLVSSTVTYTATNMTTTVETSVKAQYSVVSILPFPFDVLAVSSLIAGSAYSAYRWGRGTKLALRQDDELFAGYLAKLEEMRLRNEIGQVTYEKLKAEYWTQIKGKADRAHS